MNELMGRQSSIYRSFGRGSCEDENEGSRDNSNTNLNRLSCTSESDVRVELKRLLSEPSEVKFEGVDAIDAGINDLLRTKFISSSAFDIRELRPPRKPRRFRESKKKSAEDEVKERRHDMYIAEFELESVLHMGPTIRLDDLFC